MTSSEAASAVAHCLRTAFQTLSNSTKLVRSGAEAGGLVGDGLRSDKGGCPCFVERWCGGVPDRTCFTQLRILPAPFRVRPVAVVHQDGEPTKGGRGEGLLGSKSEAFSPVRSAPPQAARVRVPPDSATRRRIRLHRASLQNGTRGPRTKGSARMTRPKNFAILGVGGYIAPRHLKAIRDTGNRLVAACDPKDSVGHLDQFSYDVDFFTETERFDRHLEKRRRGPEELRADWLTVCSPNYLHD